MKTSYIHHNRVSLLLGLFVVFVLQIVSALLCSANGNAAEDTHDEFYFMSKSSFAQQGKGIVSLRILSKDACQNSLDFNNQGSRIDAYFLELGQPLVEVLPGFLTNHPTNMFSQLDTVTLGILDELKEVASNSTAQYEIQFICAPFNEFFVRIEQIIGVPIHVYGKANRPLWVRTFKPVLGSDVVNILESFCRLDGWMLRMNMTGGVDVFIGDDQKPCKWVVGQKTHALNKSENGGSVNIFWQPVVGPPIFEERLINMMTNSFSRDR